MSTARGRWVHSQPSVFMWQMFGGALDAVLVEDRLLGAVLAQLQTLQREADVCCQLFARQPCADGGATEVGRQINSSGWY